MRKNPVVPGLKVFPETGLLTSSSRYGKYAVFSLAGILGCGPNWTSIGAAEHRLRPLEALLIAVCGFSQNGFERVDGFLRPDSKVDGAENNYRERPAAERRWQRERRAHAKAVEQVLELGPALRKDLKQGSQEEIKDYECKHRSRISWT